MTDPNIPADELRYAKRAKPEPYVRVSNEEFLAASQAEQRVIIAKDVLEWIRERKLEPWSGTYINVKAVPRVDGSATEPRIPVGEVSTVNSDSCYACGLGALFALTAERGPFEVKDAYDGSGGLADGMRQMLAPYFSPKQLTLIECAFERSTGFSYDDDGTCFGELLEAANFGRAVDRALTDLDGPTRPENTDRRVMRAIMQNIIDNNGTFIP